MVPESPPQPSVSTSATGARAVPDATTSTINGAKDRTDGVAPSRPVLMMKRTGGSSSRLSASSVAPALPGLSGPSKPSQSPGPTPPPAPDLTRVVSDITDASGSNRRYSSGPLPTTAPTGMKRTWPGGTHAAEPGQSFPKRSKLGLEALRQVKTLSSRGGMLIDGGKLRPVHHELAAPDRPYTMYKNENGQLITTFGALIPAGYLPDKEAATPWRCPDRACENQFERLTELGEHFQLKHRATTYHDNGDGTLTSTGTYGDPSGVLVSPPIVTSRERSLKPTPAPAGPRMSQSPRLSSGTHRTDPMPRSEPSPRMAPPEAVASGEVAAPAQLTPRSEKQLLSTAALQNSENDFSAPLPANPELMWEFVKPHLSVNKTVPNKHYVKEFLTFPRRRDLEWNEVGIPSRKWKDSVPRDISSLIMHVTGEYAPEPCIRCKDGKGPYRGCVLIPQIACEETRSRIYSCSNCLYKCNQTNCSLKEELQRQFHAQRDKEDTRDGVKVRKHGSGITTASIPREKLAAEGVGATPTASRSREGRGGAAPNYNLVELSRGSRVVRDSPPSATPPKPASEANDKARHPSGKSSGSRLQRETSLLGNRSPDVAEDGPLFPILPASCQPSSTGGIDSPSTAEQAAAPAPAAPAEKVLPRRSGDSQRPGSPIISRGERADVTPASIEMENWEVGPGVISSGQASSSSDNIAFSNSYLASRQSVRVAPDIFHRMEFVRPGSHIKLTPDRNKTRTCIISAGKVRVTISGETFTIGPNGVVHIKPGAEAVFQNRLYVDACIHISSIATATTAQA